MRKIKDAIWFILETTFKALTLVAFVLFAGLFVMAGIATTVLGAPLAALSSLFVKREK